MVVPLLLGRAFVGQHEGEESQHRCMWNARLPKLPAPHCARVYAQVASHSSLAQPDFLAQLSKHLWSHFPRVHKFHHGGANISQKLSFD